MTTSYDRFLHARHSKLSKLRAKQKVQLYWTSTDTLGGMVDLCLQRLEAKELAWKEETLWVIFRGQSLGAAKVLAAVCTARCIRKFIRHISRQQA